MKTANLVISCPDRPGIVRSITDFLFQHNTNISYLEQHIEDNHFFMRTEWQILNSDLLNAKIFHKNFTKLQNEYKMKIKVDFNNRKKRLGLFCSKELHCLIDILGKIEINEINVEVPFIISNYTKARNIANKFNVPFFHIPSNGNYEKKQLEIIKNTPVDFIGLARYMKILSKDFLNKTKNIPTINIHHSFLPSFIGANPYQEAHKRGVKLIGATAHFTTPELDQGPIIEQNVKRINHSYDVPSLKMLGRKAEREVFAFAIKKFCENKLVTYKNRVIVFS